MDRTGSAYVLPMFFNCSLHGNSMNNLLSYCGLVDARISASEKDLPVLMLEKIVVLINQLFLHQFPPFSLLIISDEQYPSPRSIELPCQKSNFYNFFFSKFFLTAFCFVDVAIDGKLESSFHETFHILSLKKLRTEKSLQR